MCLAAQNRRKTVPARTIGHKPGPLNKPRQKTQQLPGVVGKTHVSTYLGFEANTFEEKGLENLNKNQLMFLLCIKLQFYVCPCRKYTVKKAVQECHD